MAPKNRAFGVWLKKALGGKTGGEISIKNREIYRGFPDKNKKCL